MPNVLSIFSGGGGIDCGFRKAGYNICLSTDNWKPACDTLEQNHVGRLVVCEDIRKVDYAAELEKIGMSFLLAVLLVLLIQSPDFIEQIIKER